MFDPFHNAREKKEDGSPSVMYMVKGNWWGSWEGLSPDVGIVNWSGGITNSYNFFATQGHQQIISGNEPANIGSWLDHCKGQKGIAGVMYTTWVNDFGEIVEKYVDAVKTQEAAVHGAP